MTIRSLNFTGRARITLDRIKLRLDEHSGSLRIVGSVDLAGLGVSQSRLVLDLYRTPQRVRVELGDAGGLVPIDQTIDAFAPATGIMCNVLALSTSPGSVGKVTAAARQVRPEVLGEDSGRQGLLDFMRDDSLGQLIWKFDASNDKPEVHINGQVEDWKGLARSLSFRLLVMPQIARECARWVVSMRDDIVAGNHEIASQWAAFFKALGADVTDLQAEDPDAVDAWVDHATERFANRNEFLNKMLGANEEVSQ